MDIWKILNIETFRFMLDCCIKADIKQTVPAVSILVNVSGL